MRLQDILDAKQFAKCELDQDWDYVREGDHLMIHLSGYFSLPELWLATNALAEADSLYQGDE